MMKLSKYFDISSKNKSLKNILNNIFLYSFTSYIQPYENNGEKIFAQILHFLHLTTKSSAITNDIYINKCLSQLRSFIEEHHTGDEYRF